MPWPMRFGPPPRIITFRFADGLTCHPRGRRWSRNRACKPQTRRAGVHQAIAGHNPEALPFRADGIRGLAGEMGNLPVGETQGLGFRE